MNRQNRNEIYPGLGVAIILKKEQRSGKLTYGIVKDLLTAAAYLPGALRSACKTGK